jgi:hypothetical protein
VKGYKIQNPKETKIKRNKIQNPNMKGTKDNHEEHKIQKSKSQKPPRLVGAKSQNRNPKLKNSDLKP